MNKRDGKNKEGNLEVRIFGKHKLSEEELEKAGYALEELSSCSVPEIPEELLEKDPGFNVNTRDIYIDKFRIYPDEINYLVDDRASNSKKEFLVPISTRVYRQKKSNDYELECIKNI